MGLETGTYIGDLVATNPTSNESKSGGDDHLRLIKSVLRSSFPNASRAQYFKRAAVKIADYNILVTDMEKFLLVNTTAANIALTLPVLTSANDGWYVEVMKTDASINTITVNGTINGETNFALTKQYQCYSFFWTGSAWLCLPRLRVLAGVPTLNALDVEGNLEVSGQSTLERTIITPRLTSARPVTPIEGDLGLNSTLTGVEVYLNSAWRVLQAGSLPRGYIDGFITKPNALAPHTQIDFASGVCRDYLNSVSIIGGASTKKLDANWVAGTGQGMRNSTASLTDADYHLFSAMKVDGTEDKYADTTSDEATALSHLQAEPGGADYVFIRRIWTIKRFGGNIFDYIQVGNNCRWRTYPALDFDGLLLGVVETFQELFVPTGLVVKAGITILGSGAGARAVMVNSPDDPLQLPQ